MIINGIEFENQLTLKQIRLVYDYSIKEVAANLGVGETTYSRWEKNPKLMTIANSIKSSLTMLSCEFFLIKNYPKWRMKG